MRLNHFYIQLKPSEFDMKTGSGFQPLTCHFNEYIKRKLKKIKYSSPKIKMVVIELTPNPSKSNELIEVFSAYIIDVKFEISEFKSFYPVENTLPITKINKLENRKGFVEYICEKTMEGLQKAKEQKAPIPVDELISYVEDFKKDNYESKWEHKRISLIRGKAEAKLECIHEPEKLQLDIAIYNESKEIYREKIEEFLPDPLCYYYRLGSLKKEGDEVLILDHKDQVIKKINYKKLIK